MGTMGDCNGQEYCRREAACSSRRVQGTTRIGSIARALAKSMHRPYRISLWDSAHLVHFPLLQEDLQDEHQRLHRREIMQQGLDELCSLRAIRNVEAHVKVDAAVALQELDDWDLGLGNHLHRGSTYHGPHEDDDEKTL